MVVGIIAGGDYAIRRAVENAEDNATQAERFNRVQYKRE
jgi:N-acetylmuramic acid 6-phosphate etherase